jgi:hypothetical protein
MNRRDRLMASIRGEPVDRVPVSFYEINGLDEQLENPDPFNIYNHPSWAPLIGLAREKSDRIVMRGVSLTGQPADPIEALTTRQITSDLTSRRTRRTVQAGTRQLTSLTRRDRDVATDWEIEPLLKNVEDLEAFLALPAAPTGGEPDISDVQRAETALGESGIVMIDTPDPLCQAAALFDMATFTVIALTEQRLFHSLLERFASQLYYKTEAVSRALPGRLWRIYGPEYASPPFLPPVLFKEYVVRYDTPMVASIQRWGGYARIHSHGRLQAILDLILSTGCNGLDPLEPPPQGDVSLAYIRQRYGKELVLFGNLEASDLENLPTAEYEQKIIQALREGTAGAGRGFVLMPSSCPYGRELSPLAYANYCKMIEVAEAF